jgi:hypothetical protein
MTTGKTGPIANAGVVSQLNTLNKLNKATGAAPTAPTPPVETSKPMEVKTLYGEKPKHESVRTGEGKAISTTASASKLWGQAAVEGSKPPLAAMALKNLSPEQAQAKLKEVEGQRNEVVGRIAGRAEELDKKWKYLALSKKTEALKDYLSQTTNVSPELRAEIEAAIKTSETAQARLLELRQEVRELRPHKETGKNGSPEERKALAHKLWTARQEQQKAVGAATEAVDAVGLKIERLTMTEAHIDPTQGEGSKFGSMVALVGRYFELTFMYESLKSLISFLMDMVKDMQRESAEAAKRKQIEDAWRQRDDLMRRIMRELPTKVVDVQNSKPGEAAKLKTVMKVEATRLNGSKA